MSYDANISGTKAGFAGGTLLSVLHSLTLPDWIHTIILAATGATVSYFVPLALKYLLGKCRKRSP